MENRTSWQLDPAHTHTTVEFAVKHMMFTTVRGRFRNFTGAVDINDRHPDQSRVEVTIDASSIDTGVAARDAHLRSADFLDVENHQQITFRTTRVDGAYTKEGDRFTIVGELEIRGTRRPVTLDATFEGRGTDSWGTQRVGFTALTDIDRREWGLRWNQALETGGVLVANRVTIEIEAQAVEREQATRLGLAEGVTFPRVLGIEAVGVVDVASGTDLQVDQQLATLMGGMGRTFDGGYAEYTVVPRRQVIPFRSTLPWNILGAVPETFKRPTAP